MAKVKRYEFGPDGSKRVIFAECGRERAAKDTISVRAMRDRLLSGSDWSQALDSSISDDCRQAWAEYRQALRDIPLQPGFPTKVVWPVPPNFSAGNGRNLLERVIKERNV